MTARTDATRPGGVVDLLARILAGVPRLPGRAACRDRRELFDLAGDGDRDAAEQGVEICLACPVLRECRLFVGAASRPPVGVWAAIYT
ncbi:MAG: WhiB family transcriptional regulator, partial [Mycolicibacter sinensis]